MADASTRLPKLRDLQPTPASQEGRRAILLRDPLQLADRSVVIPAELAPLLTLLDGSRDRASLRRTLADHFGIETTEAEIQEWLETFDQACLLENDRAAQAMASRLEDYRCAPHRPPLLAGDTYPDEPGALRELLERYIKASDVRPVDRPVRGLISPHIDFARGGPIYAGVWTAARAAVRAAECLIILGTDHQGEDEQPADQFQREGDGNPGQE